MIFERKNKHKPIILKCEARMDIEPGLIITCQEQLDELFGKGKFNFDKMLESFPFESKSFCLYPVDTENAEKLKGISQKKG